MNESNLTITGVGVKRCSVCRKLLRNKNMSGLCSYHKISKSIQERRHENRKNHKCAICSKAVKPILVYRYRCEECVSVKKLNNVILSNESI